MKKNLLLAVVFSLSAQAQFNISATATGPANFREQALNGPNSNGEIYTVDEIAPSLDQVTISSNGGNSGYAKEGNIITLSFTASEALAGTPTVTIAGQPATLTSSENNYLATYQMTSAEAEGIIPFTIDFEDLAGNPGTTVAATTDNSHVIYDFTLPTAYSYYRYLPDAFITDTTSLVFVVTFSEFVTGIDVSDFYIQVYGTAMGNISSVSTSSGTQVYVTVDNVTGTGTIELEPQWMASIYDMAGNAFVDYGHGAGLYSVVNDQPFVRSIKRHSPAGAFTNGSSVTYRVTFSTDVTGVDAADFTLSSTGSVAGAVIGSVVTVTGSSVYDVFISGMTGEGTLRMDLNASGTAIHDDMGIDIFNEWTTTGETYTFDQTAPTLNYVDISSTPMNYVKDGDVVSLAFMAEEPITNITATIAGHIITPLNVFGNYWYGTYTITTGDPEGPVPFSISFTDLAGNDGQTVTQTIGGWGWVIYDKTPPVLTFAKMWSNNTTNTQYAKPGDYVYLEFQFSEPIYPLNVLINGNTTYIARAPNGNLQARYRMPVSAEEGPVNFSIDGYHDNAGNPGGTVTTTTDGSSVIFDKGVPTLTSVTIFSNNVNTSYAKTGDVITLNFSSSEALGGTPTVTIAGQTATVTNLGDNNWKATYQMTSSETEGIIPFAVVFTDLAGNAGSSVTLTTDGSSVTFDKTAPTGFLIERYNPTQAMVTASSLVFRVTFSEVLTGFDLKTFNVGTSGTATGTVSSVSASTASIVYVTLNNVVGVGDIGISMYKPALSDVAGNAYILGSGYDYEYTLVIAPFVESINRQTPATEIATGSAVTYRVTFSHDVVGLDAEDFTLATTGSLANAVIASVVTVTGSSVYDVSVTGITGDGTLRLDLNASGTGIQDNAGNNIEGGFATGETYTFDHTAPTLTWVDIRSTPMYCIKVGDEVQLTFLSDEPITNVVATIDGNTITPLNIVGDYWYGTYTMTTEDAEGLVPFTISFTDLAGNTGHTVTTTINSWGWVNFDNTAPTVTLAKMYSGNTNNQYAKAGDYVYLEFKLSEDISSLTILINGNSPEEITLLMNDNIQSTYRMTVDDPEGPVSFSITYADCAGNAGATVTTTTDASSVIFDKTPPVLTSVHVSSNNSNSSLAKPGDFVTATFVAGEIVRDISLTIAGHTVCVTDLGSYTYHGTYTMTTDDPEGSVTFSIDFKDLVGNTAFTVTSTTDASTVTFDKTAPTLNTVTIHSNNYYNTAYARFDNEVYLDFTASEPLKATSVRLAGHKVDATTIPEPYRGSWTMGGEAEGPVSFSILFSDLAGNIGNTVTTTTDRSSVIYDRSTPQVTSILRYDPLTAGTLSTTVVFQVTFAEAVTGVDVYDFVLTAGSPSTGNIASVADVTTSVYNVTVNVTNGGGGTLRLDLKWTPKIYDLAGNLAVGYRSGEYYTFGIPPTITCPSTKTFTNAAGTCVVSASVASLTSGATLGGAPTPTLTVLAGTTTVTSSVNLYVGTTTITLIASNGIQPDASCQYTVNVVDVLSPTISGLTASPNVLWPPNHKLRDINLSYTAADLCGTVTTTVSISSNEAQTGTSDGDKSPDWYIDPANPLHLQLRGERANGGNGRIYTILVTSTDAAGNTSTSTVPVYIVHNITNPVTGSSYKIGSTVSFGGVFWDKPGITHTGQWLIDGSTTAKGSITEPSGNKNGKITGSYRFNAAGVYKLQMNVTDQNKNTSYCYTNEDQEEIVVIYDPNGGYTYGGGYFNSPAGALTSDATFTGKANFGYTINYYKGATYPKGETQFNLIAADFEFNALNYDYLSISGAKAVFKGSGKITGDVSGVNFIMTVIDGQLDGTGIDKVHMKIYNKNTDYVYYDNEPGKTEADDPATPVGLNSMVYIYSNNIKVQKVITATESATTDLTLEVHPNPASNEFQAIASSPDKVKHIEMQIVDGQGRMVERLQANEGETVRFGNLYKAGVYYLRAIQGNKHAELKLVKLPD
jgi:hypothetical protein